MLSVPRMMHMWPHKQDKILAESYHRLDVVCGRGEHVITQTHIRALAHLHSPPSPSGLAASLLITPSLLGLCSISTANLPAYRCFRFPRVWILGQGPEETDVSPAPGGNAASAAGLCSRGRVSYAVYRAAIRRTKRASPAGEPPVRGILCLDIPLCEESRFGVGSLLVAHHPLRGRCKP